ncbi:hypothetical protein AB0D32_24105 [Micromonospora sp. NPDC048170]|uniref:hypothetical protein n=1 Tax=Micromonospora sp. NPDC048170 TaxID=3154819 RepID=UPI0033E71CE9
MGSVDIPGWHTLRVGTGDEVVLTVDFGADAGRTTAGFADLVPLLPQRYTVLVSSRTAWTGEPGGAAGPSARLDAWLASADQFGPEVVAVVGYCAGCRLAAAFTERLPGPRPPALVLLEPLPVLPRTLWYEYSEALTRLAPGLGEDVVEKANERAWARADATGTGATDIGDLAGWLSSSYAELATRGCAELDIDTEFADQLVHRMTGYLDYLTIAAAAPATDPAAALVVRSHEPVPAELDGQLDELGARRLDLPRLELLGSREVADLVAGALPSRAGQP